VEVFLGEKLSKLNFGLGASEHCSKLIFFLTLSALLVRQAAAKLFRQTLITYRTFLLNILVLDRHTDPKVFSNLAIEQRSNRPNAFK